VAAPARTEREGKKGKRQDREKERASVCKCCEQHLKTAIITHLSMIMMMMIFLDISLIAQSNINMIRLATNVWKKLQHCRNRLQSPGPTAKPMQNQCKHEININANSNEKLHHFKIDPI